MGRWVPLTVDMSGVGCVCLLALCGFIHHLLFTMWCPWASSHYQLRAMSYFTLHSCFDRKLLILSLEPLPPVFTPWKLHEKRVSHTLCYRHWRGENQSCTLPPLNPKCCDIVVASVKWATLYDNILILGDLCI